MRPGRGDGAAEGYMSRKEGEVQVDGRNDVATTPTRSVLFAPEVDGQQIRVRVVKRTRQNFMTFSSNLICIATTPSFDASISCDTEYRYSILRCIPRKDENPNLNEDRLQLEIKMTHRRPSHPSRTVEPSFVVLR